MKRLLFFSILLTLGVTLFAQKQIKVACVGNSITSGYTLPDPATQSYPAQLQKLLGNSYQVGNFGKSGATLLNIGGVWLCSGQSNMEFYLNWSSTAKRDVPQFANNQIRLFDMNVRTGENKVDLRYSL